METITLGDKRIGIKPSVLEEKTTECYMLCCYADELKEEFYPWIDQVAHLLHKFVITLQISNTIDLAKMLCSSGCSYFSTSLKFYFHDEVRKTTVSAMSELMCSSKLVVEKGLAQGRNEAYIKQLSDYIIPDLVEALPKMINYN